jgi:membrane protein implicated in regulation of membrane protease activity
VVRVRFSPGAVLTLYLAALIFGLGIVAIQLFVAGASDAGHADAGDADAHPDGAQLVSGSASLAHAPGLEHVGHALGKPVPGPFALAHDPTTQARHTGFGWVRILTSFRFYMFAIIAFGAVGAPVTLFGWAAPALTLVAALLTGVGVGALAALGFRALGRETLSSSAEAGEVLGQVGRVLVACEKGRAGKVRLTVRGQIIDVIATTDEPRLEPGAGVIVQDVHEGSVHVCAAPIELLPG